MTRPQREIEQLEPGARAKSLCFLFPALALTHPPWASFLTPLYLWVIHLRGNALPASAAARLPCRGPRAWSESCSGEKEIPGAEEPESTRVCS